MSAIETAPAILVVTGASGAGKSTLVRGLAALAIPDLRCYEFDAIGIPSEDDITARFGGGEAFQAWALNAWVARLARNEDHVTHGRARRTGAAEGGVRRAPAASHNAWCGCTD